MRVLVVEDEPYLAEAVRDGLRLEAIAADIAGDGDTALELLSFNSYDIAVLDRDIPGPSGDEIATGIVASGTGVPILMLTAADRIDDKATGFGLGADDYLTKPFELAELLARLGALARRAPRVDATNGDLVLDPARHAVTSASSTTPLTPTEFRLLARLLGSPDEVVRRHTLVAAGWPMGAVVHDNTLDTYIRRLRLKLAEVGHDGRRIETVRGVGYVWR